MEPTSMRMAPHMVPSTTPATAPLLRPPPPPPPPPLMGGSNTAFPVDSQFKSIHERFIDESNRILEKG